MNCTRLDELLDIEFGKISSETREEFDRETEDFCLAQTFNPNRFIRLLRANEAIFLFLFRYFSVTMEPHCALKAAKHLFKNKAIITITLMTDLG